MFGIREVEVEEMGENLITVIGECNKNVALWFITLIQVGISGLGSDARDVGNTIDQ